MTQDEILQEMLKCKENPYYFATTYLVVKDHYNRDINFSTPLSETEFNELFKKYETNKD